MAHRLALSANMAVKDVMLKLNMGSH